jgi:hypothetical protein
MRQWFFKTVRSDAKTRLGAWTRIALLGLVACFGLSAYLGLEHPASGGAVTWLLWIALAWIAIVTAAVAYSRNSTSRAVDLLLLIASLVVGGPVALFSVFFWFPEILVGQFSANRLSYGSAVALSLLAIGAIGLGCIRLLSRAKRPRSDAEG